MRRNGVNTEADTRSEFVAPKLIGWAAAPHAIGELRGFTLGRLFNGLV